MQFTLADLSNSLARHPDPAYVVDGDGRIVVWNSAAENALGLPRMHVLGGLCHKVIRGKDDFGSAVCRRECYVLRSVREGNSVRRFRMHVRVREGHHIETECATIGVRNSRGEVLAMHLLRLWPGRADGTSSLAKQSEPGHGELRPLPSLTARQREVLSHLALGKSTREIAGTLNISPATVRSHVEGILDKLDVSSRLEAVVVAWQAGII